MKTENDIREENKKISELINNLLKKIKHKCEMNYYKLLKIKFVKKVLF